MGARRTVARTRVIAILPLPCALPTRKPCRETAFWHPGPARPASRIAAPPRTPRRPPSCLRHFRHRHHPRHAGEAVLFQAPIAWHRAGNPRAVPRMEGRATTGRFCGQTLTGEPRSCGAKNASFRTLRGAGPTAFRTRIGGHLPPASQDVMSRVLNFRRLWPQPVWSRIISRRPRRSPQPNPDSKKKEGGPGEFIPPDFSAAAAPAHKPAPGPAARSRPRPSVASRPAPWPSRPVPSRWRRR
jgi:hypothetical protein